jgi:hypothetical protein
MFHAVLPSGEVKKSICLVISPSSFIKTHSSVHPLSYLLIILVSFRSALSQDIEEIIG